MPLVKQAVLHTIIQVSFVSFYVLFSSSCSRVYCVDVVAAFIIAVHCVCCLVGVCTFYYIKYVCSECVCARVCVFSRMDGSRKWRIIMYLI